MILRVPISREKHTILKFLSVGILSSQFLDYGEDGLTAANSEGASRAEIILHVDYNQGSDFFCR